jgi:hypothetical protein
MEIAILKTNKMLNKSLWTGMTKRKIAAMTPPTNASSVFPPSPENLLFKFWKKLFTKRILNLTF